MATLHVRNVPDPLYETLRARAERNGRSIGAEAVCLLEESLALEGVRHRMRLGRRRRPVRSGEGLFSRFSQEARQVLVDAQAEAHELRHGYLGTEHLLLGVLRRAGPVATALEGLGLGHGAVRAKVVEKVGPGDSPEAGQIPFTPRSKHALELALREMLASDAEAIGPEHLALGLARVEDGIAAELLAEAGVDVSKLRGLLLIEGVRRIAPMLQQPAVTMPAEELRVVELEGSSEEWERQLNEPATEGYELVQVVGTRAVFRRA